MENDAVFVLQRCVRGWLVTKKVARQRDAAIVLQSKWRGLIAQTTYRQQVSSALVIQRVARTMYQRHVASAIVIQRVIRGQQTRDRILQSIPEAGALTIQTAWRRHWVQRDYLLYLHDVILMQSLVRQQRAMAELSLKRIALLMLQTNVRRWMVERQFQAQRVACIVIQTKWRQRAAYDSYKNMPESAVILQRSCRGLLVRRNMQARVTSANMIQTAWRRSWPQIQLNHTLGIVVVGIQAVARGFLCRKKLGWMLVFVRLKISEFQRRKTYASMLDDACTTWTHYIELLDSGVQEVARAERLVVGTAVADQAFATALRAIAHDAFLDDDYNVIPEDGQQQDFIQHRQPHENMPTDPVLTSLMKADAKMAQRFDELSGYSGIGNVGPELAIFRQELEGEVEEVKRIGKALMNGMPTLEMKSTEKATQRAWSKSCCRCLP